jgi:hypothetical protein
MSYTLPFTVYSHEVKAWRALAGATGRRWPVVLVPDSREVHVGEAWAQAWREARK